MSSAAFGEVEAGDGAEFDAERLEKNGKYIGHEDDEQQREPGGSSGGDIRGIIPGIDAGRGGGVSGQFIHNGRWAGKARLTKRPQS